MNVKKIKFKDIPTQLLFSENLIPSTNIGESLLWIVDKNVIKKNKKLNQYFNNEKLVYKVNAGEILKDIKYFPQHMAHILKLINGVSHHNLTIVAVGGGSLGDFAGFVAATIKRGVNFVQIPTTWLAAIDSAHGGKNALNVGAFKNQIGTFYHPKKVYLIKDILFSQPDIRTYDALGEVYKMALIDSHSWGKTFLQKKNPTKIDLWGILESAIRAKYKVVQKDPYEKKGIRFILNLGHTLGHALELQFKLGHGTSVAAGLRFAIWLSYKKGYLKEKDYLQFLQTPMYDFISSISIQKLTSQQFAQFLLQDKKKDVNNAIRFVFIKKRGMPIVAPILISELCQLWKEYQSI